MIKEYLKAAYLAARKDFDKIHCRCEDSFEEWYKENQFEFKNIQCFRVRDIEEFKTHKMSIIKLDNNFHIYCRGDKSKIETGSDETGKYLKLRYDVSNY